MFLLSIAIAFATLFVLVKFFVIGVAILMVSSIAYPLWFDMLKNMSFVKTKTKDEIAGERK
jgi:hypothetical protein